MESLSYLILATILVVVRSYLLRMSNVISNVWSRFDIDIHSFVFKLSSSECKHHLVGEAWYLFSHEHDVIGKGQNFQRQCFCIVQPTMLRV